MSQQHIDTSSFSTPEQVKTRLGTFDFPMGIPTEDTVQQVYDQLDFHHAVNAYLNGLPAVSMYALHKGFLDNGVKDNDVLLFSELMDAASLFLTGNSDTIYYLSFLDLSSGPLVVEMPPESLGVVDDMWWGWVSDFGLPGADRSEGGRYLFLPPGYDGQLPEGGMFVRQAKTYRICVLGRRFLEDNDPVPGVKQIKATYKVYPYVPGGYGASIASFLADKAPLGQLTEPTAPRFVEGSGAVMNTLPPNDYSFWEILNDAIQAEPADALEPELVGPMAAIGIVKGQPFQPDERMRAILTEAVAAGNAIARTVAFRGRESEDFHYFPDTDSQWTNPLFTGGYQFSTPPPRITKDGVQLSPATGARNVNARTAFLYVATGITPAMCMYLTGIGSQYLAAFLDASGATLDGGLTYKIILPPNIPAGRFWSLIVYDNQSRSMLETPQRYPRSGSQSYPTPAASASDDGSTTVYFGPERPDGVPAENWIQTVPDKGWFVVLRLYSPLEPFFDKSWRPGEIERID